MLATSRSLAPVETASRRSARGGAWRSLSLAGGAAAVDLRQHIDSGSWLSASVTRVKECLTRDHRLGRGSLLSSRIRWACARAPARRSVARLGRGCVCRLPAGEIRALSLRASRVRASNRISWSLHCAPARQTPLLPRTRVRGGRIKVAILKTITRHVRCCVGRARGSGARCVSVASVASQWGTPPSPCSTDRLVTFM